MLTKMSAKNDPKAVAKELNDLSSKKRISEEALEEADAQVDAIKAKNYGTKT